MPEALSALVAGTAALMSGVSAAERAPEIPDVGPTPTGSDRLAAPPVQTSAVRVSDFEQIRVEWRRFEATANPNVFRFSERPIALYGVTTVEADTITLVVDGETRRGVAEGRVRLVDPEGTIEADRIEFSWPDGRGSAINAVVRIDGLEVRADRLTMGRDNRDRPLWILEGVAALPGNERPPLFSVKAARMEVRPGQVGWARQPELSLGGMRLFRLPSYRVNLNPASPGLPLPSVAYRGGAGVGLGWQAGFLVGPQLLLDGSVATFPERRTSTTFALTRSLLPAGTDAEVLTPASELSEPFRDGFLENVKTRSLGQEQETLRRPRASVSLGSSWNRSARGLTVGGRISKPWDLAVEVGGEAAGFGWRAQTRIHRIGEVGGVYQTRSVVSGSLIFPMQSIGPRLDTVVRLDGRHFANDGPDLTWARATVGAVWRPIPELRLGGGRFFSQTIGSSPYSFDSLEFEGGWLLRADIIGGSTRFSFLTKTDDRTRRFVTREYSLRQVVGPLEPFVVWRERERDLSFGIELRTIDAIEGVRNRLRKRAEAIEQARRRPSVAPSDPLPATDPA
ncbi:MAG: hypothetical protein SNJ74_03175 [Fimbriimonadaceae bacterium]